MQHKRYLGMELDHRQAFCSVVDASKGTVHKSFRLEWKGTGDGEGQRTSQTELLSTLVSQGQALEKVSDRFTPGEHVVLSLPPASVFMRYIEVPARHGEAFDTAVNSVMLRYFPVDFKKHKVRRAELAPLSHDSRHRGMVVFIFPRSVVDAQTSVLQKQNLTVAHIEVCQLALARWLVWEKPELATGTHLFVALRHSAALIGAISRKFPFHASYQRLPLLEYLQGAERPVADWSALGTLVDDAASRILRVLTFLRYRLLPTELKFDSVVLLGRGAEQPQLVAALQDRLKLPVQVVESSRLHFETDGAADEKTDYTVAAALSLKMLEDAR